MLPKEFQDYVDQVMGQIQCEPMTREKIRQSLTEHIEVLIEQYGSVAMNHLEPAEQVAQEFMENLPSEEKEVVYRERPWWVRRYHSRRLISQKQIFNMPLYHITDGYNPETGKFEIAKGFFALGPIAYGVFSFGGVSFGLFSFGGLSVGLILALGGAAFSLIAALGAIAIAGLLACGAVAMSWGMALGALARGYVAIGDDAAGKFVYDVSTHEGNAVEWFQQHLPYFTRFFK